MASDDYEVGYQEGQEKMEEELSSAYEEEKAILEMEIEELKDKVKYLEQQKHAFLWMDELVSSLKEYREFLRDECTIKVHEEKRQCVYNALKYNVEDLLREVH